MKTLILTISLMVSSVFIFGQNSTTISNNDLKNETVISENDSLSSFTMDVALQDNFKYHEFLKVAANSKETYQLGQQIFTKKEFTKLIRRGSKNSKSLNEFEEYLDAKNPQITSHLSNTEMILLYQTFREGTFQKYVDDLVSNF